MGKTEISSSKKMKVNAEEQQRMQDLDAAMHLREIRADIEESKLNRKRLMEESKREIAKQRSEIANKMQEESRNIRWKLREEIMILERELQRRVVQRRRVREHQGGVRSSSSRRNYNDPEEENKADNDSVHSAATI